MTHDVFVSYPHDEKPIADAVVNSLENRRVRCWVAPRDVPPGADWAGAIMTAISSCRMVVLVFSDSANDSDHILREVRAASDAGIPIIPFRTTDAAPSPSLQYYLGGTHWLDALSGSIEAHLHQLATTVAQMLGSAGEPEMGDRPLAVAVVEPATPAWPGWGNIPVSTKIGAGFAVAMAIVVSIIVAATGSGDETVTDAELPMIGTEDSSDGKGDVDEGSDEASSGSDGPKPSFEELYANVEATFVLANGLAGGTGPDYLCILQGSELGCEAFLDSGSHSEEDVQRARAGDIPWSALRGAEDVAVADFDRNGHDDWVFVGQPDSLSGNPHRVCLTLPPDSPCEALVLEQQVSSVSVEVGDFDLDEDVDVLVGAYADPDSSVGQPGGDWLHVCVGDGEGRFGCEATGGQLAQGEQTSPVVDMALADVDADGNLDAVLAVDGPNQVCLGTSAHDFVCTAVEQERSLSTAVVTGDFNEDGRLDVVFANALTPIRLCFGSVGGVEDDPALSGSFDGFDCIAASNVGRATAADVGDVNGDGHLDLLLGRSDESGGDEANRTHLCLGDGTGALACEPTPWERGGSEEVLLTDLNNDGRLDYVKLSTPHGGPVTSEGSPANVTVCLGIGDGIFECVPLDMMWIDTGGDVIRGFFTGVARVG